MMIGKEESYRCSGFRRGFEMISNLNGAFVTRKGPNFDVAFCEKRQGNLLGCRGPGSRFSHLTQDILNDEITGRAFFWNIFSMTNGFECQEITALERPFRRLVLVAQLGQDSIETATIPFANQRS